MRVIQGRLSGFLKSLNICVQMQDRAIPTTSQTKMCGSAYKMLLLVNVLAKFIPEHNKERVPYIHLPTRSFSRQAGISWTIISVSVTTHCNSPTLPSMDRPEWLLLRQICPCRSGSILKLPVPCCSHASFHDWFPRATFPFLLRESSRTSLTVFFLLQGPGRSCKRRIHKAKILCNYGSPKSNHLHDII